MKKYSMDDIIKLLFAASICIMMIASLIAMFVGGNTTIENVSVRTSIVDLMKFVSGVILGSMIAKTRQDT